MYLEQHRQAMLQLHLTDQQFYYIFILDLTPGFIGLRKTTARRDEKHLSFFDLLRLILEVWRQ